MSCPRCGSCIACGATAPLVLSAEDELGSLVRCSVCGRDSRGFPGATGPVLRCIDPPQHRHLVLPLSINGSEGRVATVGRSDLMHWPERSSATNSISRTHLRIRRDGARYLVEDLSSNGTALRGEELVRGKPTEVHDGDLIALVTTGVKPVLVLEFCVPRERAPTAGPPEALPEEFEPFVDEPPPPVPAAPRPSTSKVVAASEVEPVALPDGDAPRFASLHPPTPPAPRAARPAAPSKQRESELDAGQTDDDAPQGGFEEGLAALLKKAKPGEGDKRPRTDPTTK